MQFWSLFELSRLLPNKDGAIPNALAGCILRCFLWRLYFRPGQQISTVLKWGWPDSNTLTVTSLCKVILWPYRRCVFLSPWYIYLNLWEAEVLLLPFYQKGLKHRLNSVTYLSATQNVNYHLQHVSHCSNPRPILSSRPWGGHRPHSLWRYMLHCSRWT